MTHTSTKQPSLAAIIRDLRESHARTSPGEWGKGATTHETVSRAEGIEPYKVAEFRHANDAQFCDLAHVFVPRLLSEIEALQSSVQGLEASQAQRKLDDLLAQGFRITGYSIERPVVDDWSPQRGFITHGGMVGWWTPHGHRRGREAGRPAVAQPGAGEIR